MDHPPGSAVPVAKEGQLISQSVSGSQINVPGANAGSKTSISTLMYTLLFPTLSFSAVITPWIPIRSISLALTISNPQRLSLRRSFFLFIVGALTPA